MFCLWFEYSPCRFSGDFDGALVISAHNYRRHFGRLRELSLGDEITITDANGYTRRYTVSLIETLRETEVERMIDTEFDLTLFTCTNPRTERLTIRAEKILR